MKTALYYSHKNLPFSENPTNPYQMLTEKMINEAIYYALKDPRNEVYEGASARFHRLSPVLKGLLLIPELKAMAHVSVVFEKQWELEVMTVPKKVWIQISTEPREYMRDIPCIINSIHEVTVKPLWNESNGISDPYQWISIGEADEEKQVFWAKFFYRKMCEQMFLI